MGYIILKKGNEPSQGRVHQIAQQSHPVPKQGCFPAFLGLGREMLTLGVYVTQGQLGMSYSKIYVFKLVLLSKPTRQTVLEGHSRLMVLLASSQVVFVVREDAWCPLKTI